MKKFLKALIIIAAICIISSLGFFAAMFHFGFTDIQTNKKADENKKTVICIGDSTTYGHGIANRAKNSYPAVLSELIGDTHNVFCYGINGSTVQDSGDQPYTVTPSCKESKSKKADAVIIMMGVNDTKEENWKGQEEFIKAYDKLVKNYDKEGAKIYICTPATVFQHKDFTPPITSFDIDTSKIPLVTESLINYANENGYELIDINAYTKEHREWFSEDAVHPNKEGARQLASYFASIIK